MTERTVHYPGILDLDYMRYVVPFLGRKWGYGVFYVWEILRWTFGGLYRDKALCSQNPFSFSSPWIPHLQLVWGQITKPDQRNVTVYNISHSRSGLVTIPCDIPHSSTKICAKSNAIAKQMSESPGHCLEKSPTSISLKHE